VISSNELKMDPEKVREIKEWPSPRSIFEVRSFHGLASFYREVHQKFQWDWCTNDGYGEEEAQVF
jgi:hypothetical protein